MILNMGEIKQIIKIKLETIIKHICKANGCKSGEIIHEEGCGKWRICYDGQRWFGEAPNKWGGDINSMFGGDNFQMYLRVDYKPDDTKIYNSYARVLIKERSEGVLNINNLINKLIDGLYSEADEMIKTEFFN